MFLFFLLNSESSKPYYFHIDKLYQQSAYDKKLSITNKFQPIQPNTLSDPSRFHNQVTSPPRHSPRNVTRKSVITRHGTSVSLQSAPTRGWPSLLHLRARAAPSILPYKRERATTTTPMAVERQVGGNR